MYKGVWEDHQDLVPYMYRITVSVDDKLDGHLVVIQLFTNKEQSFRVAAHRAAVSILLIHNLVASGQ